MFKRLKSDESGLTLIEITIVIVILGLLASFIAPRVLNAPDKAKVAKAKMEISALETALGGYAIDVGDYPTVEQNLRALWEVPNPEPENWNGPYINKPIFTDPWGNSYVYVYPGTRIGYDYDLYSFGKDGREGGTDFSADITNWIQEIDQ